jgi:hypothetical protein
VLAAARRAYEYPHDCGDEDPYSRNTYDAMAYVLDALVDLTERVEQLEQAAATAEERKTR